MTRFNIHPVILLIIPPFTQLNTPYPSTAYLKGFLNQYDYTVHQIDLGLELILSIFSKDGLQELFLQCNNQEPKSEANTRLKNLANVYIDTIDHVIRFLQNRDNTLAYRISNEDFLPEGPRFQTLEDMEWAFGSMGIIDKARYLATLYLDDLGDFIRETVDPHFGFSRYAEKLALSATSFDQIEKQLQKENIFINNLLKKILVKYLEKLNPSVIGITVPFPGCLLGALKCSQIAKNINPDTNVIIGGGYVNTELRKLKDDRIFQYIDYITIDAGERSLYQLLQFLNGQINISKLHNTYYFLNNNLSFKSGTPDDEIPLSQAGTPDYSDLPLKNYLSIIEIANPMHRLWHDGRWNKMTVAQGCYWQKCAFCDVNLDYINRYNTAPAVLLVDRIEQIIEQTGQSGFHFVDEAAPPKVLKELALELLKRRLSITWWSNIRFEKRFSKDLCRLLAASGCIAVSGGIETPVDRLLKKMNKGITLQQTTHVLNNFHMAGILVHAYLMFGFPSQTAQETVDSLEITRQFFLNTLFHSCFWHRFTLTAHSSISKNPEKFGIKITGPEKGCFAWNDLKHEDSIGCDHDKFGEGLNKAVYNYMHGVGLEFELDSWFDTEIPAGTISPNYIQQILNEKKDRKTKKTDRVIWLGNLPDKNKIEIKKGGKNRKKLQLVFDNKLERFTLTTSIKLGEWLVTFLIKASPQYDKILTLNEIEADFYKKTGEDFNAFLTQKTWKTLIKKGLLIL